MKIIKSYFQFFNKKLEKKIRTKKLISRLRTLSTNRIYVSNGEFKHTNNKVLINIYLYNRQKYNYIHKLKNIFLYKKYRKQSNNLNYKIVKNLFLISKKVLNKIKEYNKHNHLVLNLLNKIENEKYKKINIKFLSKYTREFYKNILKLSVKKIRLYFLYKQLILLNKSKLNYTYLNLLKNNLENLYNKNVEFNLINLKRFYLNSDLLSNTIKLKLTRNRRNLLKVINKAKNKIKVFKCNYLLDKSSNLNKLRYKDIREKSLYNYVFDKLKYKHVTGFRVEAKGRLTRRFTASRAISKVRYKGNLLNIDSSYMGLSSVMLKGNLKSNMQYTKLNSKTKIGSFGLKGWISGN